METIVVSHLGAHPPLLVLLSVLSTPTVADVAVQQTIATVDQLAAVSRCLLASCGQCGYAVDAAPPDAVALAGALAPAVQDASP